jgi:hypothetical protein
VSQYSKGKFLRSLDDESEAWKEAHAQAKQLRQLGMTDRFGMQVRPVFVQHKWRYWVEVVDRKAS